MTYMGAVPISAHHRPAPRFTQLGGAFYDIVEPARFPTLSLRFRHQPWAERVGLHELSDDEWQRAFGLFEPLPGNLEQPLALRYHGHQFQSYNSRLGDGRGFLYAQLLDDDDRLLDLATKGSGQTPWSRGGDGRLTLKGGVREILATEMLEALGVYTSKTFSVFETGESLIRHDEPSPTRACVLVRLGHSHVRFGSFQRHAFHDDVASLRALLGFCLEHYAPELCHLGDHAPRAFMQLVVARSAALCASWMAAGFVHGVLNTDNMNITGESFDYGPYRFLPTFDPNFVAAYFDHTALYAYGRQPAAVRWNLHQLAHALTPLTGDQSLRNQVTRFESLFDDALDRAVVHRLGLSARGAPYDRMLRISVFNYLRTSQMPFERLFFDWYGGMEAESRARRSPYYDSGDAGGYTSSRGRGLLGSLAGYQPADGARLDHAYFQQDGPCTLLIDEIESIWAAIEHVDNWSALDRKVQACRQMAEALQSHGRRGATMTAAPRGAEADDQT